MQALCAVFVKKAGDLLRVEVSLFVKLKGGSYRFGFLPVNDNRLAPCVVKEVAGSDAGGLSPPCFLPQATGSVCTQLTDLFVRHTKLDEHGLPSAQ